MLFLAGLHFIIKLCKNNIIKLTYALLYVSGYFINFTFWIPKPLIISYDKDLFNCFVYNLFCFYGFLTKTKNFQNG